MLCVTGNHEPLSNGLHNGSVSPTEDIVKSAAQVKMEDTPNGDVPAAPANTDDTKDETKEKGDDAQGKDETKSGEKEGDVVLIQDTAFTIKVQVPGMDPFELPVS